MLPLKGTFHISIIKLDLDRRTAALHNHKTDYCIKVLKRRQFLKIPGIESKQFKTTCTWLCRCLRSSFPTFIFHAFVPIFAKFSLIHHQSVRFQCCGSLKSSCRVFVQPPGAAWTETEAWRLNYTPRLLDTPHSSQLPLTPPKLSLPLYPSHPLTLFVSTCLHSEKNEWC